MLVFTIYHLVTLSVCADQGSAVPTLLVVIAADGHRDRSNTSSILVLRDNCA
jgi:hypothetical protein